MPAATGSAERRRQLPLSGISILHVRIRIGRRSPHQALPQQCPTSGHTESGNGPVRRYDLLGGVTYDYYQEAHLSLISAHHNLPWRAGPALKDFRLHQQVNPVGSLSHRVRGHA